MLSSLIIEDDERSAKLLQNMISCSFDDVRVLAISNCIDDAVKIVNKKSPDIIFLDINLGLDNGFDVLEKTNSEDYEIIVVSAHPEHALESIRNSVTAFLLKPYGLDDLKEALFKAKKNIGLKKPKGKSESVRNTAFSNKISITTQNGYKVLNLEDILYITAHSNYSEFFILNGKNVITSKSLSSYEEVLSDRNFLRVHKSYIVNMSHIVEYQKGSGGSLVMADGSRVPVSKMKKQELIEIMTSNKKTN